jgi:hypothetical protein
MAVLLKLFDEDTGFGEVASAEDRPGVFVDEADVVLFLCTPSKVGAIAVIHQREDAPADGDARRSRVPGLFPCCAKAADLRSLLDV